MGSAVLLRNVVGKAERRFVVAVVPLKRRLDDDAVLLSGDGDGRIDRLLRPIQIPDKGPQASLIVQLDGFGLHMPGVGQRQRYARIQEGQFPQAMLQSREIELRPAEHILRRQKGYLAAGHFAGIANHFERLFDLSVLERDDVLVAVPPDAELEVAR